MATGRARSFEPSHDPAALWSAAELSMLTSPSARVVRSQDVEARAVPLGKRKVACACWKRRTADALLLAHVVLPLPALELALREEKRSSLATAVPPRKLPELQGPVEPARSREVSGG
ncbi:hypothetical protein MAPG_08779 [Magnaporthiopsis poae ATCC 64411]|uniref:Uncharacterized protein n=1 Tax=Magnaporthiopsis poae (strain ATCC 64411 / 73-15) TaxID=644358 RepID=A0A0C4E882_MAGP6|nr:hypothetical protein MAPG_08779 [Magnaporthiopsis poae ATCC 64411]